MTENAPDVAARETKTKTCEACGQDFACGAGADKCWCFEIDLTKETLTKLQADFKSCLCPECLAKRAA